jgi:hypothetical protein
VHTLAPERENCPSEQLLQLFEGPAALNLPPAHAMQLSADWPSSLKNLPAAHSMQDEARGEE